MSDKISDRFIPQRIDEDDLSRALLNLNIELPNKESRYETELFQRMFELENEPTILHFNKQKKKITPLKPTQEVETKELKTLKKIPSIFREYQIKNISDAYYHHCITGTRNRFGVLNYDTIVLNDFKKQHSFVQPIELSCIQLTPDAKGLFFGTAKNPGTITNIDLQNEKGVRDMSVFDDMPLVLSQSEKNQIFYGTLLGNIYMADMNCKRSINLNMSHTGMICGLDYQDPLLASGGDDNNLFVWDIRKTYSPISSFKFNSPIRALAFYGDQILAGEETQIHLLSINKNKMLNSIDSRSLVANLHVSTTGSHEFVSTHCAIYHELVRNIQLWKISSKDELIPLRRTELKKNSTLHSCVLDFEDCPTLITSDSSTQTVSARRDIFEQTTKNFEMEIR